MRIACASLLVGLNLCLIAIMTKAQIAALFLTVFGISGLIFCFYMVGCFFAACCCPDNAEGKQRAAIYTKRGFIALGLSCLMTGIFVSSIRHFPH